MTKHVLRKGQRFGMLSVVIGDYGVDDSNRRTALCVCDCKKETVAGVSALKAGRKKSCGCMKGNRAKSINKVLNIKSLLPTGQVTGALTIKSRFVRDNGRDVSYEVHCGYCDEVSRMYKSDIIKLGWCGCAEKYKIEFCKKRLA